MGGGGSQGRDLEDICGIDAFLVLCHIISVWFDCLYVSWRWETGTQWRELAKQISVP